MSGSGDSRRSRQGIALVVVLGFLAVLTIMAVGMAISMRTERLASSSHLDMVRARMYCQAGLADSMLFLEEAAGVAAAYGTSGGTNYFMPNFREYLETFGSGQDLLTAFDEAEAKTTDKFGQGKLILPSIESDNPGFEADLFTNSLISGLGTNWASYMPGLLWRGLYDFSGSGVESGTRALRGAAHWIHTTGTERNGDETINGRFMYLIFNASGRFDVNYMDKEIPPYNHPMKVHGSLFQSITANDVDYLSTVVRHETAPDLAEADIASRQYSLANETPWEIETFSYFPPMRRVEIEPDGVRPAEDPPAFLSTNMAQWVKADIVNAFDAAIQDAEWKDADGAATAEDLYDLLVDYADSNFVPENPEEISVEPVPMINELMVSSNQVSVEVWAPFVGNETNRYTEAFELRGRVDGTDFSIAANMPQWQNDVTPPAPKRVDVVLPEAPSNSQFRVEIDLRSQRGEIMDRVVLDGIAFDESWQVNDPRFNHLQGQWTRSSGDSFGEINPVAVNGYSYANSGDYLKDGDYLMYCANRSLRCTGELGYLPVAPWRTLKLYEDPHHPNKNMDPVLDYFTLFPPDRPIYGMMNPNEKYHYSAHAHGAFDRRNDYGGGYWGLYIDEGYSYKNGGNKSGRYSTFDRNAGYDGPRNTMFNTENIFSEIVNISDMGHRLYVEGRLKKAISDFKNATHVQFSELRLEHVMRRASALYHVRQNLFIICIWAQSLGQEKSGPGKYDYPITAEAQAVAMVWRDPYPDANGEHRKFVRYMRWME